MTISVLKAAKKICELGDWNVTNLQLQKILYLTHMMFMGKNKGVPLISSKFQAWDYGPVVPELYHEVKKYGSAPIRAGFYNVPIIEGTAEAKEIEEACTFLLRQPASRLVDFTHRPGGAWDRNYLPRNRGVIIPDEHILAEFAELFNGK